MARKTTRPGPGVPEPVRRDHTPIPIDTTIYAVHEEIKRLRHETYAALSHNDGSSSQLVIDVKKVQRWWAIITVIASLVVAIAGIGAGYVAIRNEIATDAEVNAAFGTHNQNPLAHTVLVDSIRVTMSANQCEQRKRNEYQFEFSQWLAQLFECQRTRCKHIPVKPTSLSELEKELHSGKLICD